MPHKRESLITEGPLFKGMLLYAIPLMIGNLVSIFFNAADIAILGNYADANSVAAVGATSQIISLLVSSFIGISAGTNVILSRFVGAKDRGNAKKCIDTSIVGSFFLGLILVAVGLSLSKSFLVWTSCPEDILHDADVYLKYYFLGIPAMMVYNFGATVIRAGGDSKRPLYYLAASGALNVVLNFILCIVLEQKVIAVAVATLVSQCLGAVLVIMHLVRSKEICSFSLRSISFSWRMLLNVLKIGLPCAINGSLFSISNLQIQSAINVLGPACIAGNTVSGSVEGFVNSAYSAMSTTAIVYISQNFGALRRDRVNKTIIFSSISSTLVTVAVGNLIYLFGRSIFSIYIPGETEAIEFAMLRASYLMVCYFIPALKAMLDAATQAYGYSVFTTATSILSILGLRIVWMSWIYPLYPYYESIIQCYVISWLLSLIMNAVIFFVIHKKMLRIMADAEQKMLQKVN